MNVTTVLDALATLLWLVLVGLFVLTLVRASRGRPVRSLGMTMLAVGIAAFVITIVSAGLVFIQPEERGVVISAVAPKGYREQALQPGLEWVIPFVETVRVYPISRQTYTMSIASSEGAVAGDDSIKARTLDGQEVSIDASVIYAIDPDQVIKVHIEWQNRYSAELIRPLVRGIIRDVIAQYGVQDVYSTQRTAMTDQITDNLRQKLNDNGLLLMDFVLRNITFSPEFAASVEQKQIAEQQAQQAKYVVEQRKQEAEQARQVAQGSADAAVIRAKGEADARLIQAEAEAKALERFAQALEGRPELLQYVFYNKIGPGVQSIFLPSTGSYILPLPQTNPSGSVMPADLLPTPPVPTPLPTPAPTATP